MKIATIIGARPQFIKAATLSRAIATEAQGSVEEILIHTGQHYDANMSGVFFQEMELPHPHYELNIGSGSHGAMTGRMLESIEQVLLAEKPDWTVVYGDTNSTLAGALASAKLHIPIAHVEAGLRSFNKKMPEEINRILVDHCAALLLTPTEEATAQLKLEGIPREKIAEVGDVMYEAALFYQQKAYRQSLLLKTLSLRAKEYVLATIHRAENTDDPIKLKNIIHGLGLIGKHRQVVWPVHPRTRLAMEKQGLLAYAQEVITLIDPVGYLDMLNLETHALVILTDSGGVQKEAYFFKVPCLTIRDETEWRELVLHGFNRLVSTDPHDIAKAFEEMISKVIEWDIPLYGKGDSASQILRHLKAV